MMPINVFASERRAANLLHQVRWHDGVYCPRCRAESAIQYGSYRQFQRYRCKNCDRTFNDKTGTVFAHSTVALRKWFLAVYTYIRLNTSIRQLDVEIDVSYKTVYRRVQRFLQALDAPRLSFEGPVEIDELYVTAGLKGREREQLSRSRGLRSRGRGTYQGDNVPVFTLVDRGTGHRYAIPARRAKGDRIELILAASEDEREELTVYTDGFSAYNVFNHRDDIHREYVIHGNGEYVDGNIHINGCESHGSLLRPWLSPHRGISKDKITPYVRAFQLRQRIFRKPGREALKIILETAL